MNVDTRPARGFLFEMQTGLVSLPWGQLRLIASVSLLIMVGMLNFAPLLPVIRAELGLSNTWAAMLGSATILTHTLLQLPGGQVVDSLGPRRSVLLSLGIVGASVAASGVAPSFPLLLLARLALGVGTAIGFVAGLAFTNSLVSAERRVMAQSVFGAGASLGILVVLLLSERASVLGGWRAAFIVEGVSILLLGWLIARKLRDGGAHSRVPVPRWSAIVRLPYLYLLGAAHVVTYGIFMGVTTWVVTFLVENHGISLGWAGPLSALLTLSALGGRFVGGTFSAGRERQVMLAACALSALSVALLPLLPGLPLTLGAMIAFGWFVSIPFGAIFAYASLVARRAASGRELSLVNFIANLGALAFPPLIGFALDTTASYTVAFGMLAAFGLATTAGLAAWLPKAKGG